MKNILLMFLVSGSLAITSCGRDGDPGAQGPAGPKGNANVKNWFLSTISTDWQTFGTPGNTNHSKYVTFSIPELTSTYVDNGMVLVYLNQNGFYTPLPITAPTGTNNVLFFNYVSIGNVEIDIQLSDLSTPNTANANYDFKVVAVAGSVKLANPNLNWKDYNEVKKRLNLVE